MKATSIFKSSLLIAGLIFTLASCTKIEDNLGNGLSSGSNTLVPGKLGILLDSGLYKGELRHMHASFTEQGYIVDHLTGETTGTALLVNLGFNTDTDDKINSGRYDYSVDKFVTPFTFDSGFMTVKTSNVLDAGVVLNIVGGSVTVNLSADEYTFTFDLQLDNGDKLEGSFSGKMDYYDAWY
jgi:hypothetical protein